MTQPGGTGAALEERDQPYLCKLKLSKNVKRHIGSLFRQSGWTDAGQGWEGKADDQQLLAFVESNRKDGRGITGYEYAVLVSRRLASSSRAR